MLTCTKRQHFYCKGELTISDITLDGRGKCIFWNLQNKEPCTNLEEG